MLFQNPYSQLMAQLPQPTPGPFTRSRPAALGPADPSALPAGPLMMAPPQPVAGPMPEQGPPPALLPTAPMRPNTDMLDTMNLAATVGRGGLSDLALLDRFQGPQRGLFGMNNNMDIGLGSMATPTLPVGLPPMGLESMATPTLAPTPVSDGGFTGWLSNLFGGF